MKWHVNSPTICLKSHALNKNDHDDDDDISTLIIVKKKIGTGSRCLSHFIYSGGKCKVHSSLLHFVHRFPANKIVCIYFVTTCKYNRLVCVCVCVSNQQNKSNGDLWRNDIQNHCLVHCIHHVCLPIWFDIITKEHKNQTETKQNKTHK